MITEKPDVAKSFASFVKAKRVGSKQLYMSSEYVIIPCIGHLLSLKDMKDYDSKYAKWELGNYPFFPNEMEFKINEGTKTQVDLIRKYCEDDSVDKICSATDNDREGEIIGAITLRYTNTQNKPVYRLVYDAVTFQDFSNAMRNLVKDEDRKLIQDSGFARLYSDWLIGINLTSVATLKLSENDTLHIGRVILPITKFVYDREKAIDDFESVPFYELKVKANINGEEVELIYLDDENNSRLPKGDIENIRKQLKEFTLDKVEKKQVTKSPENLHSLTSLTRYLTKKHKMFNTSNVLSIYQKLYELGYLSYPRTSSRKLMESEISKFENVFKVIQEKFDTFNDAKFHTKKTVFDDEKVVSHSAITPTHKIPAFDTLNEKELTLYTEILHSFMSQFMPKAVFEETSIVVISSGYEFVAKFKMLTDLGYLVLYPDYKKPSSKSVNEGDKLSSALSFIHEGKTSPPTRLTESDLLGLMESVGKDIEASVEDLLKGYTIGTGATRNAAIEKVKTVGYVKKKGNYLYMTDIGKRLIEKFPNKKLLKAEFTGMIGKLMNDIEIGELTLDGFLAGIKSMVADTVQQIKDMDDKVATVEDKTVCTCSLCGSPIVEAPKAYGCMGFKDKGCNFVIFKNANFFKNYKIKPTKDFVKSLVENNLEITVMNLPSTKNEGRYFDAKVSYQFNKETGFWDFVFDFENIEYEELGSCPKCSTGKINEKGQTFSCDSCDFRIFKINKFFENRVKKIKPLKRSDIKKLLKSGYFVKTLLNKDGNEYKAKIGLDDNKKYLKIIGFHEDKKKKKK